MVFRLDESDVLILSAMLQTVSGMAADNLKFINPRPYKRDDPDIASLRNTVVEYMTLRNRLLKQLTAYQHGETATATENAREAGLQAIADAWNAQIMRIKGTPEKDCDGDFCKL